MTLSDAARAQRVKGWTNQKSKWKSKLEKASDPYDIDIANAMIADAEEALKRLEVNAEVVQGDDIYEKSNVDKITKKVKANRSKRNTETPLKTREDTSSIGV